MGDQTKYVPKYIRKTSLKKKLNKRKRKELVFL